jgi:uncharacterized RDD family membrane protein YckC
MDLNLPKPRMYLYPASFLKRAISFLIDALALNYIVLFPFHSIIQRSMPSGLGFTNMSSYLSSNPTVFKSLAVLFVIISIIAFSYFVMMQFNFSQTLGQMFMNIYIYNKGGVKFWQCVVDNLFILPIFPFILFWFIEPVSLLFTKKRVLERLANLNYVTKITLGD